MSYVCKSKTTPLHHISIKIKHITNSKVVWLFLYFPPPQVGHLSLVWLFLYFPPLQVGHLSREQHIQSNSQFLFLRGSYFIAITAVVNLASPPPLSPPSSTSLTRSRENCVDGGQQRVLSLSTHCPSEVVAVQ